jgi:hypothetical protein
MVFWGIRTPQLRQRGTAQIDRCRSRQKLKINDEIITVHCQLNDAEKYYDNKTTKSKDKNIELSRKLGLESSNIIIRIFVTGEIWKVT